MNSVFVPSSRWRRGPVIAVAAAIAVVLVALGVVLAALTAALPDIRLPAAAQGPVAARVSPGLANVAAQLPGGRGITAGTGMVLTPSGRVLTSNHVIEGATSVVVTDVGDGRSYPAAVVGYDAALDVAVLQMNGASGLPTVSLATSAARVGDPVLALGNSQGLGGAPVEKTGTVTGLNAAITAFDETAGAAVRLTGLIRTSVPLEGGDSGGPLVTPQGLVVGMNTASSSQPAAAAGKSEGFAVPAAKAACTCAAIVAGKGSATTHIGPTASLGVTVAPQAVPVPGRAQATGAGVVVVPAGTPAAGSGLAFGDVIVSLGGQPVSRPADLRTALVPYHPGDRVSLTWIGQDTAAHAVTVRLKAGPAE